MKSLKKYITAFITLLAPNYLAIRILNLLGHDISNGAYIGINWLLCEQLTLGTKARIGHFNLIRIDNLSMGAKASIRSFNRLKGPFDLMMSMQAAIGNSNSIYRGPNPITSGSSELQLGRLAIITSKHQLDCTKSITIGNYTTISGFGTQIWTHGFYHAAHGPNRIRIDGSITIGNNVSIGSRCLINPGVSIGNAINVGGNSCVSKSLVEQGMYVSQGLRHIPTSLESIKNKLVKNQENYFVDVYEK